MKRKISSTPDRVQPLCSKQARYETSLRYESCAGSVPTWLQELPAVTVAMAPQMGFKIETNDKKRELNGSEVNGQAAQRPPMHPVSEPNSPTATVTSLTSSTTTSNRCGELNYREKQLNHNGVWIDAGGLKLPAEILQYTRGITRKQRNSPGPSSEEWLESREVISELHACNKRLVRQSLLHETLLFPRHRNSKGKNGEILIWRDTHVRFDATSVPRKARGPAIVAPKPDWFYGYTPAPFGSEQSPIQRSLLPVMERDGLARYAKPSTSLCLWPFLIIEFMSLSGNALAAENQNAGTGAASVNSMQTLFGLAYPGQARPVTDSLVFSCVVSPAGAGVWIHWRPSNTDLIEEDSPPFFSAQVEFYSFRDEEHLNSFRVCLLNIMDWALGDHLAIIKDALAALEVLDTAAPTSISRQEKAEEEEDEKGNGIETTSAR